MRCLHEDQANSGGVILKVSDQGDFWATRLLFPSLENHTTISIQKCPVFQLAIVYCCYQKLASGIYWKNQKI
jgi:hypothetical protein